MLRQRLQTQIRQLKDQGLYKQERIIQGAQQSEVLVNGKKYLNMCANNYLGLSNHPAIKAKSTEYLHQYGAGLSSVRFICGTQDIHKKLEDTISKFHQTADTILYPSCFDANAGLFEGLLGPEDAVLSDELNHASIIDGIRLCKAKRFRYKNRDMADLEAKLKECSSAQVKLIATDGVFSMDGTVAPLDKISQLAKKYNALVFVDECHATGFLGPNGQGTASLFGLTSEDVHITNSTLGKAMSGSMGGYTTSSIPEVVQILRQRSRPYLFSNSLAPAIIGAAQAAYDLVQSGEGQQLREKLFDPKQGHVNYFRNEMKKSGFQLKGLPGDHQHPIVPVMIQDAQKTVDFAQKLLDEHQIYVIPFSYPVVPKGQARIRVQLSASHSKQELEYAVAAFKKVGKQLHLI